MCRAVAGRVDLRLPHVVEPRQIPGGQQLLHVHLRRLRLGLAQGRGALGDAPGPGPSWAQLASGPRSLS